MMKRYVCRNERCADYGQAWSVEMDTTDVRYTGWVGPAEDGADCCETCGEVGE